MNVGSDEYHKQTDTSVTSGKLYSSESSEIANNRMKVIAENYQMFR